MGTHLPNFYPGHKDAPGKNIPLGIIPKPLSNISMDENVGDNSPLDG